jgi:hypothetical protein
LKFDPTILTLSRKEMMERMAQKVYKFHEVNKLPLDGSNETLKTLLFNYQMPLSLHGIMFLKTL